MRCFQCLTETFLVFHQCILYALAFGDVVNDDMNNRFTINFYFVAKNLYIPYGSVCPSVGAYKFILPHALYGLQAFYYGIRRQSIDILGVHLLEFIN